MDPEDDDSDSVESIQNHSDSNFQSETDDDSIVWLNRVYGKQRWKRMKRTRIDRVPYDINGKCAYSIKARSRSLLLERCKDGRPWKKNTRTKWAGYERVRYKDCKGSLRCPNVDCHEVRQMGGKQ